MVDFVKLPNLPFSDLVLHLGIIQTAMLTRLHNGKPVANSWTAWDRNEPNMLTEQCTYIHIDTKVISFSLLKAVNIFLSDANQVKV